MRVLVDTHTLIWALTNDPRLSRRAKQILQSDGSDLMFSLASLWEMSIKIRLGKLRLIGSSVSYVREEMKRYRMELLGIQFEHILRLEMLPSHHGDPFDRLLIAQALEDDLTILTEDEKFPAYGVKLTW